MPAFPHTSSSRALRCLIAASCTLAPSVIAQDSSAPIATAPIAGSESPFHLSAGLDITSAYMWRGYRFEDSGLIAQPYATLSYDLISTDDLSLQATLGVWESIHSKKTDENTDSGFLEPWYEADYSLGFSATKGPWTLGVSYNWYASPSNAFDTYEEFMLSAAFDDEEAFGAYALAPSLQLGLETGKGLSDGVDKGVYAQVGIAPGYVWETASLGEVTLSLPCAVGLSVSNYYQDSAGDDETFGFANLGARVSVPLPVHERFGSWSAYAQVTQWFLGGNAAASNDDEHAKTVLTIGLGAKW